ncbi:MAG: FtsX-like permease family protein [Opitutales bacterium]
MSAAGPQADGRIAWILLRDSTLRHWLGAKWSYLLIIVIVAVGVGSLNGIRQASRAATANFGLFNEAVSGRSEFLIEAPVGALDEEQLVKLRAMSRSVDWHLLPVVEGSMTHLDADMEPLRQLRLVGLDLISVANLPNFIEQDFQLGQDQGEWYHWVGSADQVWVNFRFATESGLGMGDRFTVSLAGKARTLKIAGVLGDPQTEIPDDLMIADLPVAQAWLERESEINRIEVIVADREMAKDPEALNRIEQRLRGDLPEGLILRPAGERAAERAGMTAAFRLNLMILSLIAMLVGAYLILQALDAAVVRRRGEIATLKSLGVSARAILFCLLLEAALIGLIGSVLGIGVGLILASAAVHVLADTVNVLYFATSFESIQLTGMDLWVGGGIGFFFSLLAGWLPARDAMFTPPAQILARGDWSPGFKWLRSPGMGGAALLVGCLCLLIPPPLLAGGARLPLGGFLAAGCWIFAAALLSGGMMVALSRSLRKLGGGPVRQLALSRLADGSSRHRLAVAGLVVAVGMVTGMLQMVGSFRGTIVDWFDVRFQADLYVSERGIGGASTVNGIRPEIIDALSGHPAVAYADTLYMAQVDAPRGQTMLAGVDFQAWTTRIAQIWHTRPGQLDAVEGAQPALVSETFARRFDVVGGGVVEIKTPSGVRAVSPVGIYSDYGNEFGTAAVDHSVWKAWVGHDRPLNTSLFLEDGVERNRIRDALRLEFPGLDVRNAQELRTVALGIFEQTFRVTSALNAIGIAVAMAGLVLGLFAIFAESARTWLTLDHLGFSRSNFVWTAGLEGAGIALSAWVSGTLVGLALGWLLIYVINVQSFGWTLVWELPIGSMLGFGALLVLSGLLCGLVTGAWLRPGGGGRANLEP